MQALQLELFPQLAVRIPPPRGAIIPPMHNIRAEYEWRSVRELLVMPSGDFGRFGSNDECMNLKRNDYGYEKLKESLVRDGWMTPIYLAPWDESMYEVETIYNGHHRLVAAYDIGYTHVPTTNDRSQQWAMHGCSTRDAD